ncbi:large conductance mechanosensitive channel protein MscL [Roseicyclus sp. F158]|uniref:Large-conductance mechanosensitive channel n=1 Tax=Tropicimonas omnivorans TaxID=3075590 RepID=A0ABU3DBR4_9RHOB|nr:large conductance mechanosensitive channel protein MscL [Roseicyclus sp. F158]MDT0681159.1 large conductance mechanosensitive channel protein MscL [Roseicyclus sp. F158]
MLTEFRNFIARGNVMDMAVGIIVGAAFTAIVTSLVGDLINPFISLFTGGIDFTGMFYVLGATDYASLEEARASGDPVFAYGAFVMAVINFLIVAFVVFLLVKLVNRVKDAAMREEVEAEPSVPPADPGPTERQLLIEIRDALLERPRA